MSAIWDTYKYGKKNPFCNDPMQKAYYHPSTQRSMDGKSRQAMSVSLCHKHQDLTVEEESREYFLDRSNSYLISRIGELCLRPDGDSVSFDESWPQSERPSTISISEVENLSPPSSAASLKKISVNVERNRRVGSQLETGEEDKHKNQQRSNSEGSEKTRGKESTLSKYIERFRNSQPMSREQRLQMKATTDAAAAEDFWWLLQSPSSRTMMSSPTDQQYPSLQLEMHTRSVLQDEGSVLLHDDERLNKKTKLLQENVDNFLETMSSMGSSHPAVSTVGLGSDTVSLTTLEEESYRPAFIRSREPMERRITRQPRHPNGDDILQRWRNQRKRELAKDQVTKFKTEQPSNNYSSQRRQPDDDSATSQMTYLQTTDHLPPPPPPPPPPPSHSCSQPADQEKNAELKRDAVIQTSGVLDDPLVSYVPHVTSSGSCPHVTSSGSCPHMTSSGSCPHVTSSGSCPHPVMSSGTIALVIPPRCHLNCDLLTQTAANRSCRDSRHKGTTTLMGDNGDGPKQVMTAAAAHKAQGISGEMEEDEKRRRRRTESHAVSLDYLSDENIPEKDVRCPCLHAEQNVHLLKERVNRKRCTPQKDQRSLRRPLKVSQRTTMVDGHDLNDTDVWQTTDEEKRRIEMEEEEEEERKSEEKERKRRQRRRPLCAPKNQSSPIPIRSTIRQAINDQLLLGASASIVSSMENFELSSLDLTVTELEEPVEDRSVPAANDQGGSSPPVDLESVIYSDGEEFADDDILCNLRQRRLFCLQRVHELDQLILESNKT